MAFGVFLRPVPSDFGPLQYNKVEPGGVLLGSSGNRNEGWKKGWVTRRARVGSMGLAFFMAGAFALQAAPGFKVPAGSRTPAYAQLKNAQLKNVKLKNTQLKNDFGPLTLQVEATKVSALRNHWSDIDQDSNCHVTWRGGKAHLSHDFMMRLAQRRGLGLGQDLGQGFDRGQVTGVKRGAWRRVFAERLSGAAGFKISADAPAYAAYEPNDTWFKGSPQWALQNPGLTLGGVAGVVGYDVGMTRVWDKWGGSDSMVIAVVDAGFNFAHPDLQGRWFVNRIEAEGTPGVDDDANGFIDDSTGWDFVEGDADVSDGNGHGTEVASVIAATFDNALGIAGMLPEARVMPIRVLDASGRGEQADIAAGIRYAVSMGVDVINFSIGGASDGGDLRTAFAAARDLGIPVVAAAGNEGVDLDADTPAPFSYGFDNVIGVASINHGGQFSEFSNYGANTVDLAAPGENVLTCGVGERVTSFKEDFEGEITGDSALWDFSGTSDFRLTTASPLEAEQSLEWVSGVNTSLTTRDFIDLRGKQGGLFWFQVQFTPGNSSDAILVEAMREGDSRWITLNAVGGARIDGGVANGMTGFDNTRFKLRLRTSASGSVAARKLRIDFVNVSHLSGAPLAPDEPSSYPVVAGTSIAAPHVAAYVALLKTACRRMGVPFTKAKVLEGVVPDTACAGRTRSGGRLDVYRGLAFYLKTLPSLQLVDSTRLSWRPGDSVAYTLRVADVGGVVANWALAVRGLGDGGHFDAATGRLIWAGGIPKDGLITFRAQASGATVLRRHFAFTLTEAELPVSLMASRDAASQALRLKVQKNLRRLMLENPRDRHWVLGRGAGRASFP
jgi:Subtilase family